jgi:hypothetical protein
MENEHGKVVEHKSDLYTTYDVTDKGYCVNIQPRKLQDIFNNVNRMLKEKYPKLCEDIEYFGMFDTTGLEPMWDMGTHWTSVFYVEGGSEGYYVHVEAIKDDKRTLLFLGKTLREGEAGISWAEQMVCAISRIMKV